MARVEGYGQKFARVDQSIVELTNSKSNALAYHPCISSSKEKKERKTVAMLIVLAIFTENVRIQNVKQNNSNSDPSHYSYNKRQSSTFEHSPHFLFRQRKNKSISIHNLNHQKIQLVSFIAKPVLVYQQKLLDTRTNL